jgi:hypothetical protein
MLGADRVMRQMFTGAALLVAGVATFIEAAAHQPGTSCPGRRIECPVGAAVPSGLSQTAYDLLRIGGWALVIFGTLLVVTGLIRFWASQTRAR